MQVTFAAARSQLMLRATIFLAKRAPSCLHASLRNAASDGIRRCQIQKKALIQSMRIINSVDEMQTAAGKLRRDGTLGLVPTMGALHAGHLSLIGAAKRDCAHVVASIFVNPLQFGPNEDFSRYPRTFDADCAALSSAGVDVLFAPSAEELTPAGATTFVEVGGISDRLDGASRPGHFRGVATIVAKLFHIVAPHRAYFGQKDAAQLAVLRALVRDLNLPVEIIACPIVREPDGLALSSRNRYLTPEQRSRATILHRALDAAADLHASGERNSQTLSAAMLRALAAEPSVKVEYAAVVDPGALLPLADATGGALIAVAAHLGETRLIDNHLIGADHA
jgi:pantoate--beta-alanine ligase